MSVLVYYLLSSVFAIAFVVMGLFFAKKSKKSFDLFLKMASVFVFLVFSVRYMFGLDAIQNMFALGNTHLQTKTQNFFALMLVWFSLASSLLVSLYGFFKFKLSKNLIKFLALPISFLSLIFMFFHFEAIIGAGAINQYSVRGIFFAIETGSVFGYSLLIFLQSVLAKKSKFAVVEEDSENIAEENIQQNFQKNLKIKEEKSKKSFKNVLKLLYSKIVNFFKNYWFYIFAVLVVFLSVMPAYTFQGLFGFIHQSYKVKDFEIPHRIILYISIILPFIVHFSLHKKDYQTKKFLILYICLGTLLSYSLTKRAPSFLNIRDWPLHLCNTAMYIMPMVLVFNMKRFFYFTYFINVIGAFFAMIMPNYNGNLNMFSSQVVVFYINHFIAFFMPILFVSLKLFEKPKLKQFIYSMIGFGGYFLLVLILNAYFSGVDPLNPTDFFFINSDFIAEKLGTWAENLRDVVSKITIGGVTMTFYPVYQALFFVVYVLIGLGMWFGYESAYQIADGFRDIAKRKEIIKLDRLALEIKLDGRSENEPMNKNESNKLVLKDFSKCYGSSEVYAVYKANLEINGGEIFGFLGPNGSGKSTIIKTIVGIQPISSGEISVCGYDVNTQAVMAKSNLGYVPDHYALYEKLTGREYINYIADLYNVSEKDRTERIDDMVNRFELVGAFDNQMKTYSHGMKQKIAIMSALVHNPKIWILDEPLTGLDPTSIYQVKECMKEHAKKGNIVFFSSHIIDVVERICDRISIIKKGHILCTKSVKEIEESGTTLEDFYLNAIKADVKPTLKSEAKKDGKN